jgi:hypothetical protein
VASVPAAEVHDRLAERCLLRDQRRVARLAVIGGGEERAHLRVPRGGLPPRGEGVLHHLARALLRIEQRLLRDVPDLEPAPHAQGPAIRRLDAGEDPRQGRLPRPVRADEPDPLAARQREGRIIEDHLRAKRLSKVLRGQGGHWCTGLVAESGRERTCGVCSVLALEGERVAPWRNGIRSGLKIRGSRGREGSSPSGATEEESY